MKLEKWFKTIYAKLQKEISSQLNWYILFILFWAYKNETQNIFSTNLMIYKVTSKKNFKYKTTK